MLGAIIGDIVGSVYEYDNIKTKDFEFLSDKSFFTDDTIMTIAVADALLNGGSADNFIDSMKKFGRLYPKADYGSNFGAWLMSNDRKPYNSWGNGSAMRVSPCAWFANSLDEAEDLAERSAAVTHNHPEGIKGAKAVVAAIYLARTNKRDKPSIKDYIERKYGYDLGRTIDQIRPTYTFDESCQETVPEAIIAFLESDGHYHAQNRRWPGSGFVDAVRNAVSLGGDSDTVAAITGSIAEAEYGIPLVMLTDVFDIIDDPLAQVINAWLDAGKPSSPAYTGERWELDFDREVKGDGIEKPHIIKTNIPLSQKQFARMRYGNCSSGQDEKWESFYWKGRHHKIRIGAGKIFEAEIAKGEQGYYVSELIIQGFKSKPKVYRFKSDEAAIAGFCKYHIPYIAKKDD
jgi:ADP-ribosylglycohydrolase